MTSMIDSFQAVCEERDRLKAIVEAVRVELFDGAKKAKDNAAASLHDRHLLKEHYWDGELDAFSKISAAMKEAERRAQAQAPADPAATDKPPFSVTPEKLWKKERARYLTERLERPESQTAPARAEWWNELRRLLEDIG
jgi:hypothetical protein